MNKFGKTCVVCGSSAVAKLEEKETGAFHFERVNYSCGAILKTYQTANDNSARAILSGCTSAE